METPFGTDTVCFGFNKKTVVFQYILCFIVYIISLLCIFFGLYHCIKARIIKSIKISYFFTILTQILSILLFGLLIIIANTDTLCMKIKLNVYMPLSQLFYGFSLSICFYLYLIRLRYTFIGTEFELGLRFRKILNILFIIQNISNIVKCTAGLIALSDAIPIEVGLVCGLISNIAFLGSYLSSNIIIIKLFIRKSVQCYDHSKSLKHKDNYLPNLMRVKTAIKYINCVIFGLFTTTLQVIATGYAQIQLMTSFHSDKRSLMIVFLAGLLDTFMNIFIVHLQFNFMSKCYVHLCNPIRIELNILFKQKINHEIQLSTEMKNIEIVSSQQQSSTTNETTQSTKPESLEPTKTDSKGQYKRHGVQPTSSDLNSVYSRSNDEWSAELYVCRFCPLI